MRPAPGEAVLTKHCFSGFMGTHLDGELRKRGIKCKVIFVSGYAEDAFAKNLPAGEDFGFLPKPFSLKQLIEAVKGGVSQTPQ